MANNFIQVNPDNPSGKKLQTFDNTISGNDVHAEAVVIVDYTGASPQYSISVSNITGNGTVAAGTHHIEFILSSDFNGTIGGVTILGSNVAIYSPGESPVGSTFGSLSYTISAGSAILTTW